MPSIKEQLIQIRKRLDVLEGYPSYKESVEVFHPLRTDERALTRNTIRLYGTEYQLAPLDHEELEIFNVQFPKLLAASTSIARQIQLQRVEDYITAIRAIKHWLHGVAFRGLQPGDSELGFQWIRPQFTHDPNAATYRKDWRVPLAANTWTAFIGTGHNIAYTVGKDFGIVVTHVTSHVRPTPFVTQFQTNVHRAQLSPITMRSIVIKDTRRRVSVYPLPTLLIMPTHAWFVQLLANVGGTEDLELGGLVIGLGRALRETTPTWS